MAKEITPDQQVVINHINSMERKEMCRMWRFAPPGHPYFRDNLPYFEVFRKRLFDHFGGFTPEISKIINKEMEYETLEMYRAANGVQNES